MPRKKTAPKPKHRFGACRLCSICGGKTISSHRGKNVCRACSVFYRRSSKRIYECSTGENNCAVNKGASCKKCRFELIGKLIASTGEMKDHDLFEDGSSPPDLDEAPGSNAKELSEPSGSNSAACDEKAMPILDRVRSAYSVICKIRVNNEMLARPKAPHPFLWDDVDEIPIEKATVDSVNCCSRIAVYCGTLFARSAFPEFSRLSKEDQWTLVLNFSYRFGLFESAYRADKAFPNDPERLFSGYTHAFVEQELEEFPNYDKEACGRPENTKYRSYMKRLRLSETEFLLLMAIIFWSVDGLKVTDSVAEIVARCRNDIMQELHVYFRRHCEMDNYAARLGELLAAVQFFDESEKIKEYIELLRLVDIFTDDSFVYKINRDTAL